MRNSIPVCTLVAAVLAATAAVVSCKNGSKDGAGGGGAAIQQPDAGGGETAGPESPGPESPSTEKPANTVTVEGHVADDNGEFVGAIEPAQISGTNLTAVVVESHCFDPAAYKTVAVGTGELVGLTFVVDVVVGQYCIVSAGKYSSPVRPLVASSGTAAANVIFLGPASTYAAQIVDRVFEYAAVNPDVRDLMVAAHLALKAVFELGAAGLSAKATPDFLSANLQIVALLQQNVSDGDIAAALTPPVIAPGDVTSYGELSTVAAYRSEVSTFDFQVAPAVLAIPVYNGQGLGLMAGLVAQKNNITLAQASTLVGTLDPTLIYTVLSAPPLAITSTFSAAVAAIAVRTPPTLQAPPLAPGTAALPPPLVPTLVKPVPPKEPPPPGPNPGPGPDPGPPPAEAPVLFITTATAYFANVAAADALCQSAADGAALGGTFKAVLKNRTPDGDLSDTDGLTLDLPPTDPAGTVISTADTVAELFTNEIGPLKDASGQTPAIFGKYIWSGLDNQSCNNWNFTATSYGTGKASGVTKFGGEFYLDMDALTMSFTCDSVSFSSINLLLMCLQVP